MLSKKCLLISCLMFCALAGQAQLTVQGGYNALQLAQILAGPNLAVSNATIVGSANAYGSFDGSTTNLNVNSGVLLTSGSLTNAIGPNIAGGTGDDNGQPGTADLDVIAGITTYDAVTLEFDFTVETDNIQFKYVFASEEYPEFAPPNGSTYNDVFAFFISGPGIAGKENVALVPNTTSPVSIVEINAVTKWQYYVDNAAGATIEFDAFTTVLTAERSGLTPCATYTLTLTIADAGDGIYDSGVFLQENSLVQGELSAVTNTISGDSVALEGCIQASFTFNIDTTLAVTTYIPLIIGGTAINGIDYAFVDSLVIIPAGQTSGTIVIDAFADGIPEGTESIFLIFTPLPCEPPDTVFLYIDDNTSITYQSSGTDAACYGDSSGVVNLNISGGNSPYGVVLNGADTFYTDTIANLPAGSYGIEILDFYGCGGEALTIGGMFDAGATFIPDGTGLVYTTTIPISGFAAGQLLTDVNQLQFICLALEHSFMGDIEIRMYAPDSSYIILKRRPGGAHTDFGEPCALGQVDVNNPDTTMGICYDYCFSNNPTYGTMVSEKGTWSHTYTDQLGVVLSDNYIASGAFTPFQAFAGLLGTPLNGDWTIWVKDYKPNDNGWICNWSISITTGESDGDTVIINNPNPVAKSAVVTGASCGSSNGDINLTVSGDFPPFTFSWSSGPTTEDISGLAAGTYSVTVTDANNCSSDTSFLVQNTTGAVLSDVTTLISCPGGTDGSINLTATGGTAPLTFLWSNSATTEDISGLSAGTYIVTVTDSVGCLTLNSVDVIEVIGMTVVGTLIDENCGDQEGEIDITLSGGNGSYAYLWSDGMTSEDVTDLSAGTYTVTVTDALSCTITGTFTLLNMAGNCIPFCDLAIVTGSITDEICGNGQGGLDLTISGGIQPIDYLWSNTAITEDLVNLSAGAFSVTVSDVDGCEAIDTFVVANNSGTLSIVDMNATDENCGDGAGAIDMTALGGVLTYTFLWSNSETTEDLSGLSAGNYIVTLTDANGCIVVDSAIVLNITNTLAIDYQSVFNEICGDGQGSIDVDIIGGTTPYTYLWSTGATSEDLTNLIAGNYQCTITDQTGCQLATPVYNLINEGGTLAISGINADNEICANSGGDVNITVTGGAAPLTFLWNIGATTEDISGLSAGTYSVTITDNNGCSITSGNILLLNESGTMSLDLVQVIDEVCGNGLGSVNITVSGGNGPLTYLWNTGSGSEDLYNLSAGTYTCTIDDSVGCQLTANGIVANDPGILAIQNLVVTNETCADSAGAIDVCSCNIFLEQWSFYGGPQ